MNYEISLQDFFFRSAFSLPETIVSFFHYFKEKAVSDYTTDSPVSVYALCTPRDKILLFTTTLGKLFDTYLSIKLRMSSIKNK